jgi:hypothetical protein
MTSGFKLNFSLSDVRNMVVSRNKDTVWIGTRKIKVWQPTGAGN